MGGGGLPLSRLASTSTQLGVKSAGWVPSVPKSSRAMYASIPLNADGVVGARAATAKRGGERDVR